MPGGRPTLYEEKYNEQAYKLCLLGANDEELADFFEVDVSTINNWKIAHPEFFEALTRGKIVADAEVAHSFHKRAVGYEYKEVTFEKVDSKQNLESGNDDSITTEAYKKKIVIKELPPDPGAALSWLKNRQPKNWRDKQEIDHTTKGQAIGPIDYSKLSDAALREISALRSEEGEDRTSTT